jgi:hypothetical protein
MRRFRQTRYRNRFSYTGATHVFSHDAPLRVTPRWGYPGWDGPPRPRLTPGVINIASLRDASGFSNASALEKCERARKKRKVSWLISIRLAENFGLHPNKRGQISLWHPKLLIAPAKLPQELPLKGMR